MSALDNVLVDITVRDNFYSKDPATHGVNSDWVFTQEFYKVIDILKANGINDIHPPAPGCDGDFIDKEYSAYVEVSCGDIIVGTNYYDDKGALVDEDECSGYGTDYDVLCEVFNQVKALFDPAAIPILASSWDELEAIRVSHDEIIFSLSPDKSFDD